jgi:DNA-binding response OmpR family regulator
MRKAILLVEDSKRVLSYNRSMLQDEGFEVLTAATLAEAREIIGRKIPDAVILDIGMPDGSGLDLLRELRAGRLADCEPCIVNHALQRLPVLLLTGYGKSSDVVLGFKTGCDDYLPKPYTFEVLLARLTHLLKSAEQMPEVITRGTLTLKPVSREAFVNGEDLRLTPKDYSLLHFFVQNENTLLLTDFLYESVWGQPMSGDSKALGVAVSRLRKKLAGCGYTISTEYKNGYRFERGGV